MSETGLTFYMCVRPVMTDVAEQYAAAEKQGLRVKHANRQCHEFEDVLESGRFVRMIGGVTFDKKRRSWCVHPREDCTRIDLATLMSVGLRMVARFGTHPGHGLRGHEWNHYIGVPSGHPVAGAFVTAPLDMLDGSDGVEVSMPDDIGDLTELLDGFRIDVDA